MTLEVLRPDPSPDGELPANYRGACWCTTKRKPCEYHAGFEAGWYVALQPLWEDDAEFEAFLATLKRWREDRP